MIIVNGMEYKTLAQNLYADGKKVLAAYCNGNLVYPEREDAMLLKVIGNINTMISHDHNGENHTVVAGGGAKQNTYHGGDDYRAKGCFSLVVRRYDTPLISYSDNTTLLPSAKWPLSSSYSSNDDNYKGNAWMVFPYTASTAPMIPEGDGIHPLFGSDEMAAHAIVLGRYSTPVLSIELLLHLDVSAPRICPFSANQIYIGGLGYPYMNAEVTPLKSCLDELPADVNGFHRMYAYRVGTASASRQKFIAPSGRTFYIDFEPCNGFYEKYNTSVTHLQIRTARSGYEVPYIVRGTRQGVYREARDTYKQKFNILNIPITDKIYSGSELTAPEEHLHPRIEDLMPYI